jgi:hypothetical protein
MGDSATNLPEHWDRPRPLLRDHHVNLKPVENVIFVVSHRKASTQMEFSVPGDEQQVWVP